ncbi:MAG: hypothetical protein ABIH82_01085 [Candidatus Woesearchaeota archaeon]
MAINLDKSLKQALDRIESTDYKEFLVHNPEVKREWHNSDRIMEVYGDLKWKLIGLLNETYSTSFSLENWLKNQKDEVSYFLNEAGSNVLSYSEFKAPFKFHLWLGKKGFVIGIEQKGQGFDAEKVDHLRLKENEGAAFDFFRNATSEIFFDNKNEAKIIFMEYLI